MTMQLRNVCPECFCEKLIRSKKKVISSVWQFELEIVSQSSNVNMIYFVLGNGVCSRKSRFV